jgi:tetratricopeptide (TPR) repeat protein
VVDEVGSGEYQFSQAVIWDTFQEDLPTPRRLQLHNRIGVALEKLHAGNLEPHVGEIAHHFLEAGPAGDVEQAVRFGTAAAARACSRLAYEEGARLYERTLLALDPAVADGQRRCDLLLALADAHAHAGSSVQARRAFGEAAEAARRVGSPEHLARAALGFGGPRPSFGVVDREHVALLEQALSVLGQRDRPLRACVLARFATELYFDPDQRRRKALIQEAVGVARRGGDPATLAYVLNARYAAMWGAADIEERLAIADEVLELAERARDREVACEAHSRRAVALLERGDVEAATAALDAHRRLAEELRYPLALWQAMVWRATLALLAGQFAEGEALAEEALAYGRRVRLQDADSVFAVQGMVAKMELGHLEELVGTIEELAERLPATRVGDAGIPYIHAELGHRDDAAAAFDVAARHGFAGYQHDYHWLPAMTALADVCAFLGDTRRAAELYELLRPYAGQNIVAIEGWFSYGSADRPLAVLATTMQAWDAAEGHFQSAVALNTRIGARGWLARTQLAYAQMLLERRTAGDEDRARRLLEQALDTARELGMFVVRQRIEAQLAGAEQDAWPA